MSEARACFVCGGHGYQLVGDPEDDSEREVECRRCKGSGGLYLRTAGPGVPKSDDPYAPVPKGTNW